MFGDNWAKLNNWDILTYLRSKPILITKDKLEQLVPDWSATRTLRELVEQHQTRCELAAKVIEELRRERDESRRWSRMRKDRETIKKLTEERDEARREICYYACGKELWSYKGRTPAEVAEYQGWDCFNLETFTKD